MLGYSENYMKLSLVDKLLIKLGDFNWVIYRICIGRVYCVRF